MARLVSIGNTEPVTLAEAKAYAKVDHSADDAIITALITSCRKEIEERTKNAMLTQVWEDRLDAWPYIASLDEPGVVFGPRVPLSSATVEVIQEDASFALFEEFEFEADSARIAPYERVPTPSRARDGVRVTYTTTITTVDPTLKTALLELITYRYDNRSNGGDAAVMGWPASVRALVGPLSVINV